MLTSLSVDGQTCIKQQTRFAPKLEQAELFEIETLCYDALSFALIFAVGVLSVLFY